MGRIRTSAALAAALALCGCGLPNYPTLNPPGTPSTLASETNTVFTILSTTQNNELEFRGYELFYKFYASTGDIEQNLQDVLWSDLIGTYGYRQVCDQLDTFSGTPPANLHSTRPYPLINVQPGDPAIPGNRGSNFTITVTFPGLGGITQPVVLYNSVPYSAPNDPTNPLSLRRNVGDINSTSSTYQEGKYFIAAFLDDPLTYQSSDRDVQGIWGSIPANTAYLAMYVLSYGIQDFTTDLYSTPVYLGYIPVDVNQ